MVTGYSLALAGYSPAYTPTGYSPTTTGCTSYGCIVWGYVLQWEYVQAVRERAGSVW